MNPTSPKELILSVENHHYAENGNPPGLMKAAGDGQFVGYFQSAMNDQFVVQIDRDKKTGTLWGGDIGWNYPIKISNNRIQSSVILGKDEIDWLEAAWHAATLQILERPFLQKMGDLCSQFEPADAKPPRSPKEVLEKLRGKVSDEELVVIESQEIIEHNYDTLDSINQQIQNLEGDTNDQAKVKLELTQSELLILGTAIDYVVASSLMTRNALTPQSAVATAVPIKRKSKSRTQLNL